MDEKKYKPHEITCTCLDCKIGRIPDDYDYPIDWGEESFKNFVEEEVE